jgi:hypothetical protein
VEKREKELPKSDPDQQETASLVAADLIGKRSETGELTASDEILAKLTEQGLLKTEGADQAAQVEAFFKHLVERNEDLQTISGQDRAAYYYSTRHMAESYAEILIKKREDPLLLMAKVIRENSARYPRPIPLHFFQQSPFNLTEGQVQTFLKKMEEQKEYQDIRKTITSIHTVFVFSARHLEADHAALLAEWLDVGQANNP